MTELTPEQQSIVRRVKAKTQESPEPLTPAQQAIVAKVKGVQDQQTAKPGLFKASIDGLADTVKSIPSGVAEPLLAMGTGMIAKPIADIAGLASIPLHAAGVIDKQPINVQRDIMQGMTYSPRTALGSSEYNPLNAIPQVIAKGIDLVRPDAADPGRSDTLMGMGRNAARETIPQAIGLAGLKYKRVDIPNAPANKFIDPSESVPKPMTMEDVAGALKNPKKAAEIVDPDLQILSDAEKMDMTLNPTSYSKNEGFVRLTQAMKSRPDSKIEIEENQSIKEVRDRADRLIEDMGGQIDKSLLDENLKRDFDSARIELEAQEGPLYRKVDEMVGASTEIPAESTKALIKSIVAANRGNMAGVSRAEKDVIALLQPGEASPTGSPKRVQNIRQRIAGRSGKAGEGMAFTNPSYEALNRVRQDIGQAINESTGPYKEVNVGRLKRLYGALSEDQKAAAKVVGADVDLATANDLTIKRKALEDNSLIVFGRDLQKSVLPKLKSTAGGLTGGDVKQLEKLINAIPESRRQEAAATLMGEVFTSGSRTSSGVGAGFMSAFEKLNRSPGAKEALFKHLPKQAQERFDMIGRVTTGIYKAKAFENKSRSANSVLANVDNGGILSRLYDAGSVAKKVVAAEGAGGAVGVPLVGGAAALGAALSKVGDKASISMDRLIASPAFKADIMERAMGKSVAKTRAEFTPEYKRWLSLQNEQTAKDIARLGFINWLLPTEEPKQLKEGQ